MVIYKDANAAQYKSRIQSRLTIARFQAAHVDERSHINDIIDDYNDHRPFGAISNFVFTLASATNILGDKQYYNLQMFYHEQLEL
jgi:hypothetical protein